MNTSPELHRLRSLCSELSADDDLHALGAVLHDEPPKLHASTVHVTHESHTECNLARDESTYARARISSTIPLLVGAGSTQQIPFWSPIMKACSLG